MLTSRKGRAMHRRKLLTFGIFIANAYFTSISANLLIMGKWVRLTSNDKCRLDLYKSVLFQQCLFPNHSMLLKHRNYHHLVPYVILALGTYVRGFVNETPNQCSTQVVDLPPGQEYNLTIPCAKYVSADIQLSNGSIISLPTGATDCASTATQTDLQLYLSDTAPQGSLNLTIFCQNVAPVCYSFRVEAPNQSTQKHDYSLREVCSLNNATVRTNSSSLGQAQAMPPNTQDSGLAAGATATGSSPSAVSLGQPLNSGDPAVASPTDSGSQPLSQVQPAGATPTGSSPSGGSSASPGSSSIAVTQNASAPGGGASSTTAPPPRNGQAMAASGGPALAGGPSGPTSSYPQSTCLCTS